MKDDSLQKRIEELDGRIIELLNQKARLGMELKSGEEHHPFPGTLADDEYLYRLHDLHSSLFPFESLRSIFVEINSAIRQIARPLRAAYLGPEATFAHVACLERFGSSTELIPARTIGRVLEMVEQGEVEYGVIPVENSTEGSVNLTLDTLVESSVQICGEIMLGVTHSLLSMAGSPGEVKKICSHPQAIAQCKRWLEENYPDAQLVEVSSTAKAAEIASKEQGSAAISSERAANLYGLQILFSRIEDNPNNYTRFLVAGRGMPEPTGRDKTSILFAVKHQVGSLVGVLDEFARSGINLTKIESRPSRRRVWEYVFFVDLEGHVKDPLVAHALEEAGKRCIFLKVLGSYPRSDR